MAKNVEEPAHYNIISAGTEFDGNFKSTGSLRIDGSFKGNLWVGGKLVIGQGGVIEGKIECCSAEIEGRVKVSLLYVKELFSLKSTAILYGDVRAGKVSIEQGAVFVGHCAMPKEGEASLASSSTSASASSSADVNPA